MWVVECEYDGRASRSSQPYAKKHGVRSITFWLLCEVEELSGSPGRGGFWLDGSGLGGSIGSGVLKRFE